jgi:hypothetical protein
LTVKLPKIGSPMKRVSRRKGFFRLASNWATTARRNSKWTRRYSREGVTKGHSSHGSKLENPKYGLMPFHYSGRA